MVLPGLGCSSSNGNGGGGSGGSAGAGGSAGTGGSAGAGGSAGEGGSGGSGGVTPPQSGLWMGEGAEGAWTACFVVNEGGTALIANGVDCQNFAIQVGVAGCGSLWSRPDLPIEGGAFEISDGNNTITGTFDSPTMASGTFSNAGPGCSGNWEATPVLE